MSSAASVAVSCVRTSATGSAAWLLRHPLFLYVEPTSCMDYVTIHGCLHARSQRHASRYKRKLRTDHEKICRPTSSCAARPDHHDTFAACCGSKKACVRLLPKMHPVHAISPNKVPTQALAQHTGVGKAHVTGSAASLTRAPRAHIKRESGAAPDNILQHIATQREPRIAGEQRPLAYRSLP